MSASASNISSTAGVNAGGSTPKTTFLALLVCCLCAFAMNVDNTIVNIALPDIGKIFHPKLSELQWVIDAFLLVIASLIVCGGSLGDRYGRRKISLIGLIIFALGSLFSSFSTNVSMLIGFRVIQALGGALLIPANMSLLSSLFPDPKEKARAFSIWGMMVGVGMASGPLIGGFLVNSYGWRSVFWINIPVCLLIIMGTIMFIPEFRAEKYVPMDIPGQIFMLLSLLGLIFTVIEFPNAQSIFSMIIPVTITILCVIIFVLLEKRVSHPLIDLRFFSSIQFSAAMVISVLAFTVFGGVLFINTLYLQDYLGEEVMVAGLCTVPLALSQALSSRLGIKLLHRWGFLAPTIFSACATIVASILAMRATSNHSILLLLVAYVFFGSSLGIVSTPINTIAMAGMPKDKAGVASALASGSRQIGQSVGVALLGTVFTAGLQGKSISLAAPHALIPVWLICVVLGVLNIIFGFIAVTKKAKESALRLHNLIQI